MLSNLDKINTELDILAEHALNEQVFCYMEYLNEEEELEYQKSLTEMGYE